MERDQHGNVIRQDKFTQVCVWPGTLVNGQIKEFVEFFQQDLNARIQYLEEVQTAPDLNRFGSPVEGTGGRNDVIFAVHEDDVGHFAVPRLRLGIRWIEDVLAPHNHSAHLYEARLHQYKCWDTEETAQENGLHA